MCNCDPAKESVEAVKELHAEVSTTFAVGYFSLGLNRPGAIREHWFKRPAKLRIWLYQLLWDLRWHDKEQGSK